MKELNVPTLITVHNLELMKQWRDEIKKLARQCRIIWRKEKRGWQYYSSNDTDSRKRPKIQLNRFSSIVMDECVTGDTLIETDHGKLLIKDIVEKNLDVRVLTHTGEYKKIKKYHKIKRKKSLISIETNKTH